MSAAPSNPSTKRRPPGPSATGRGPGPFLHLYTALSIHCILFTWCIYGPMPREVARPWDMVAGATLLLALLMTSVGRYAVQDWYSALSVAGRFLYLVVVFAIFWIPDFWDGHSAFPEGFALALPAIVFTAVGEHMVRRVLLFTTIGFWAVCASTYPPSPWMLLGFGFTLIWCFGASHFAFTGHLFGLKGWWPLRKVLQMTALYFLPSAAMATLIYYFWPPLPPRAPADPRPAPNFRQIQRMDQPDLIELVVRMGVGALLLIAALLLLYYIRRRLGRRRANVELPNMMVGDVGSVGYEQVDRPTLVRGLTGRRGQIVSLWTRWAARAGGEEQPGRLPHETAEEVAARLSAGADFRTGPRGDLTSLFERAHYGSAEPTAEEVDAMRTAVKADLDARKNR